VERLPFLWRGGRWCGGDWDEWSDCLSFGEVGGGVGVIGTSGATAFPLERPPCYLVNLYHVPDIVGHLLLNQCDDELINALILSYVLHNLQLVI